PIQMAFSLVPASNALLMLSFVLSGYGAYLLAAYLLSDKLPAARTGPVAARGRIAGLCRWLPAFFAGIVYAYSSSKLFYASLGQFNIASSQWIPFCVLYVLRAGRDRSIRSSLLAALFLLLQAYAELTFATFLAIFIVLYALYETVRRMLARGPTSVGMTLPIPLLLRNVVIIALVAAAGIAPILANMVPDMLAEGDFFASGGGFADVFSTDLASFLVPTQLHPLLGGLVAAAPYPHDKGQHLYLGLSVLALGLWGLWRGRRSPAVRFWGLAALVFFSLTLGPTVRVDGQDSGIPGPFALIAQLPFLKGNRYPSRYSVMLVLSCGLLAAVGLRHLLAGGREDGSLRSTVRGAEGGDGRGRVSGGLRPSKRVRGGRVLGQYRGPLLGTIVSLLFVFEHLSIPLPLSDMRVPAPYSVVAAESGDFAVLELPIGWRNGGWVLGKQDVVIMFEQWYQTAHGKRLLGGNTSRNPEFKFQYFAQAPLLSSLIGAQNGREIPLEVREADRELAPQVLGFLGVRFVAIHEPPASAELIAYVEESIPLDLVSERDGVRLYRIVAPPGGPGTIDLSTPLGRMHLGEGWSPVTGRVQGEAAVWAQRQEVRLLASLSGDEKELRFRAWAPRSGQSVTFRSGGREWGSLDLHPGWSDYVVDLTPATVHPGLNDIRLRFSELTPLADLGSVASSSDEIGGWRIVPSVVVQSAGLESGGHDLGHIFVGGQDVSTNQRGYNVVALGPRGELLWSNAFDTHLDRGASHAMAEAIDALDTGDLVAVAAADEASSNLTEEAVLALRGIGATTDLRGKFRWGHAVVGVKGAMAGEAVEAAAVLAPAYAHVGVAATEPAVAAAFSHFQFGSER
ncbi:MAG TPA: interleukin-like EMT inducer domain-containing protein, partial [Anaerolineae bacterium]|nr:interleukin-like EMT inducer domain-containing protein [Anaerolineae bacterium]